MTSYLAQQLLNGIQLGTIYALIALGYTMVYGIIKLINFAHADIFMVGAYIAFFLVAFVTGSSATIPPQLCLWTALIIAYVLFSTLSNRVAFFAARKIKNIPFTGESFSKKTKALQRLSRGAVQAVVLVGLTALVYPIVLLVTRALFTSHAGVFTIALVFIYVMTICALLGIAMERIAYRPLRNKPRLSALITAMGVSFFLENFCSLDYVFGNKYQAFPVLIRKIDLIHISTLGLSISNIFVINVAVLAVMLLCLWLLVEKTLIGKQMRAVAFDHKTAWLMGIDVDRIIGLTFAIGPALAGVSGLLYAMNYGILQSPFLGFSPGLKAFIAAVLGGIGSLPGAVLGSFLMGTTEVFANAINSNLGFAAAFVVLIVVLLVKPNGILGKKEIDKV